MSGGMNNEPGTGGRSSSSVDEISSGQRCQSGEIAEWRSCDQVENGIATTSPPYWDTDDDDCIGPKPSELFGKFTWRIENFNQISKRELRSNVFEVGGYKWYILIYPQGCEVTNHLSLFLCVANHEKLLPGWSHFAQFTISVVNKDPKKSKYSDTLHRFWKKEHDWGWKKFMELSKVKEGFVVNENLVIKAQVQVIREKTQSPFRCLDCQYRRELIRVYVSNVEQICRRFVEERKGKLNKLIKDKARWLSFRHFWLGVDEKSRHCMLTDKTEAILKVVVKHFFIEKEVTSTLVMDSIYSGLRALESQSKKNKGREKSVEMEETIVPMVFIEKDMFVLEDDLLALLERAALESMPPKEDKGIQNQNANQNRTKDGNSSEDSNKDSIDRDERRLTELGRRTVEIFVLAHIFSSKIEVAYQEAIALKRQEELIREEEAAWQAEELKAKRGATDKDKKSKKKQSKQKRSNRKGKEKARELKSDVILPIKQNKSKRSPSIERPSDEHLIETATKIVEKVEITEDVSDVSDTGDDVIEIQHDIEDIDGSPSNCDTDASEVPPLTEARSEVQTEPVEKENPLVVDDNSSTCSTDSVPSVGINGQYKGNTLQGRKSPASPIRGKHQHGNASQNQKIQARETDGAPSDIATDQDCLQDSTDISCQIAHESGSVISLNDHAFVPEKHLVDKEEVSTLQKKFSGKSIVDTKKSTKLKTFETVSARKVGIERPTIPLKSETSSAIATTTKIIQPSSLIQQSIHTRESLSSSSQHDKSAQTTYIVKPEVQNQKLSPNIKVSTVKPPSLMSRPSTAPLFPGPKATAPLVSTVQTMSPLLRSGSTSEPLASTHVYGPQSYRNAIIGKNSMGPISSGSIPCPSTTSLTQSGVYSPPATVFMTSPSTASLQSSSNTDKISVTSGFGFRPVIPDTFCSASQQSEGVSVSEAASSGMLHSSNIINHTARVNIHDGASLKREVGSAISLQQSQGSNSYEFPHIDMINYLLDEDQVVEEEIKSNGHDQLLMNRHQYTFPGSMAFSDRGLSNGSSQYEGPGQFYDDAMQRSLYRSSTNVPYDVRMEPTVYANGHIVDPSVHGMDPSDIHRYHSYQLPDYSIVTRSFNGYNVYRPANGS